MRFVVLVAAFSVLATLGHSFRPSGLGVGHKARSCSLLGASPFEEIIGAISLKVQDKIAAGETDAAVATPLLQFLNEYADSSEKAGQNPDFFQENVQVLMKSVNTAVKDPYKFSAFHQAIRTPFDFYKFGNDFLKPLIINEESEVFDIEKVDEIKAILAKGENVVLLSNHQTEADPQVISILLEKKGMSDLAEKMIFIAGHKVTTDPIAIPFSMGRNLICIHSKKHIKNPPEDIPRKQAQNLESMKALGDLCAAGGNIFWVAPSGGRDRPDPLTGKFEVAPFDFKALDMFKLMSMQSRIPMHFFPMAMYTHKLVPPPDTTSSGVGEQRSAKRGAVSMKFLAKTDGLGGLKDKEFAADVQAAVEKEYDALVAYHKGNENENNKEVSPTTSALQVQVQGRRSNSTSTSARVNLRSRIGKLAEARKKIYEFDHE